jgi:hypothetical protein
MLTLCRRLRFLRGCESKQVAHRPTILMARFHSVKPIRTEHCNAKPSGSYPQNLIRMVWILDPHWRWYSALKGRATVSASLRHAPCRPVDAFARFCRRLTLSGEIHQMRMPGKQTGTPVSAAAHHLGTGQGFAQGCPSGDYRQMRTLAGGATNERGPEADEAADATEEELLQPVPVFRAT